MAASAKTETNFLLPSAGLVVARVAKAEQNDWIVLPYAGVIPLHVTLATGADETVAYPTLAINNAGTAYDAATTEIAYDTATAGQRPSGGGYYLQTSSGEIIYVEDDDGTNLTIRRGCLGTTASGTGLADDAALYILCSLVLNKASTTGVVTVTYLPMPEDPGVALYKT